MSSTAPTEFLSFPQLPLELREMVWDEALPTLDLQRFNAEIAPHPDCSKSNNPEDLVLCLTPNDDFVQLTSGYVGLLGACRESRRAAIVRIKGYLPIHYVAREADGSVAVRFAKVPYNPDGNFCISGLGPAFTAAADGYGARGMKLKALHWPQPLMETIQCASFPEVKNLSITLDLPADFESTYLFLLGKDDPSFADMLKSMTKLETVALVDEGWMNEWHRIDAKYREWLYNPYPVFRGRIGDNGVVYELDEDSTVHVRWRRLFEGFMARRDRFHALRQSRAGQMAAGAR